MKRLGGQATDPGISAALRGAFAFSGFGLRPPSVERRTIWPTWKRLTLVSSWVVLSSCSGQLSIATLEGQESSCALQSSERVSSVIFSTFWGEGAEGQAVGALDQATSVLIGRQPFSARAELQGNLLTRLVDGDKKAPDVFQVNGGADVLQWVSGDASKSQVCPLNVLDEDGFRSRYLPAALDPVTCGGVLYALPIGIHRVNRIYYNAEVLELAERRLGGNRAAEDILRELRTAEDFVEYLERLGELELPNEATGIVRPLAIGASPAWPLGILVFDNLMASIPGLYEAVWQGDVPSGFDLEAELRRWFRLALRSITQSDVTRSPTWRDALAEVERGRAIFTVIGDWASAEAPPANSPLRSAVFPPTRNRVIFTPDSIAVPRTLDPDAGAPARYFLTELVDNKSVMLEFSRKKSSLPPRSDLTQADLALLGPALAEGYLELRACLSEDDDCQPLLAVSGYGPPPLTAPCFDEVLPLLLSAHPMLQATEPPGPFGTGGEGVTPRPSEPQCPVSYPDTLGDIEEELVRRLMALSADPPYRKYCPAGP